MSLSDQYFEFLDLVSELYPHTEDSQFNHDKHELNQWAAAVVVFETQKQAVPPNFDQCDFILRSETFEALMLIIARRFNASKDPEEAVNLFDYGKERKSREEVRQNIKQLADIIIGFYEENKNLLDHEGCDDAESSQTKKTEISLAQIEEADEVKPISNIDSQTTTQPALPIERETTTVSALDLKQLVVPSDGQTIAINFQDGEGDYLNAQEKAHLEAIEETFAELELND